MTDTIEEYLSGNSSITSSNDALWKLLKELWDKGENREEFIKKAKMYWEGKLAEFVPANIIFNNQTHTNDNVIESIVETKVTSILDAQFSLAVVPDLGALYDYTAIKDAHVVADVLNDAIKNIFKRNNIEQIKEQVCRYGFLAGYGVFKTDWSDKNHPEGDIFIEHIRSENVRWTKDADCMASVNYVAYYEEEDLTIVKDKYAKNPDGSYNEELCRTLDEIADVRVGSDSRRQSNAVINYQNTDNNTAGRAYAGGTTSGIQAGKVVKLINMYLLDASVYAPEEKDSTETEQIKQEYIKVYPNGRQIVFTLNEKNKLILKDVPASKAFKNIGNIDIFNPKYYGNLTGDSDVERLIPIQDRINGLYNKYREKMTWDLDTTLLPDDIGVEDSAFIRSGITKIANFAKYDREFQNLTNGGVEKCQIIVDVINGLKQLAYQMAGVNETMMYGSRQKGTTSGEQVEALQESPMARIRAYQKNFIDSLIGVGEKCLSYIAENYTDQRLVSLSTGIEGAELARINTNTSGQPYNVNEQTIQPDERYIELLDEAMQAIKVIKYNPEWKFKVEVIAGTEVPRSRKEQAALADGMYERGLLGDPKDIDTMETYMRMQDIPNYREIISMLKRKQEENAKKALTFVEIMANPDLVKGYADFLKALVGFTADRATVLKQIGLTGKPDDLADAPVQETMRQVDPHEILPILPELASTDPRKQMAGHAISKIQLLNNTAESTANLMREEHNGHRLKVGQEN